MNSRRVAALLALLAASTAVACSSDPGALPKVPEFKVAATTTTGVDYSNIGLKGVPGRQPTTTVAFGPGAATVKGNVVGDDGAIPGATVFVERIVGGVVGSMTVVTGDDGTWTLPQIFGGRYRVRAWRTPDLAQTTPSALFVGATETKEVSLRVRTVGGTNVTSSFAPDPPRLFSDTSVVVLITEKVVDETGFVRSSPLDNVRVDLISSNNWRIMSANPAVTDSRGQAEWIVRCRAEGRQGLAVQVGTQTIPLTISNCVDPTAESTTTTTEPDAEEEPSN